MDARALFGLSAKARLGQMVRGGRSWPSDWNAGLHAVNAGKTTLETRLGTPRDGTVPTMEAIQQALAQKWQVAGWSPGEPSASGTSPPA